MVCSKVQLLKMLLGAVEPDKFKSVKEIALFLKMVLMAYTLPPMLPTWLPFTVSIFVAYKAFRAR
ncbi:hypothetical protein C7N43_14295 [Sphingobacteriales bacterium UPWRP_1]|nr:hypothetical protein BVG80_10000 [Sphingobacteriales bacterium TSM_CSM]PSJ76312.1 hypothetical protein C7N43_14295 [Sphingobacteriales bacterium UPWRP_1]